MVQAEKQRSPLRIYLDIIDAINEEGQARPTHILYKANLSYDRLVKYLDDLAAKGLVEVRQEKDTKYYVLTPKGVKFLIELKRAEAFIKGFGFSL